MGDQEVWLDHLALRESVEDLVGMGNEVFQDLLDLKENLAFKAYLDLLVKKETEVLKEMLAQKEIKVTGEWLVKMDLQVWRVYQEKWGPEGSQALEDSMVFPVLKELLDPKEMKDLLGHQGDLG